MRCQGTLPLHKCGCSLSAFAVRGGGHGMLQVNGIGGSTMKRVA